MIPAHHIILDAFPLNASGKVDRTALPPPQSIRPARHHIAPATLIETLMADMYATLLHHHRVGVTDSFFDLGGNSLQAMRLVAMVENELGIDIGATAMFLAPNPRQLAALLRDKHGLQDAEVDAIGTEGLDEHISEQIGEHLGHA
jgi:acyl carrier protein